MKIVFYCFDPQFEVDFGRTMGSNNHGHNLLYPLQILRSRLIDAGHQVNTMSKDGCYSADILVCMDLKDHMLPIIYKCGPNIKKIFVAMESIIYTPLSHSFSTIAMDVWDVVLTWNRSYNGQKIFHFDIPIAGIQTLDQENKTLDLKPEKNIGVVVSSFKDEIKGINHQRDILYKKLAQKHEVDLYGIGWPKATKGYFGVTNNKIDVISKYKFSLIIENSKQDGYVTEKIGDSILSGVPAIYYGDNESALKRFGTSFIDLKYLTIESFLNAKEELFKKYDELMKDVVIARDNSGSWCDSYVESILKAIDICSKEI